MSELNKHIQHALGSSDDVRIGELIFNAAPIIQQDGLEYFISQYKNEKIDIAIIGFPFDEGVKRNGGRVGAKKGPESFRKMIRRAGTIINVEKSTDCSQLKIVDLGDVHLDDESNLEKAHELLEEFVHMALHQLQVGAVFVLGGGNDQSYPNAKALLRHVGQFHSVGVVNLDAHLDVRDLKNGKHHSGSPFRRLLETPGFKGQHFVEYAAQGSQCSQVHANYVLDKGGKIYWLSKDLEGSGAMNVFRQVIEKDFENTESIFVSFDLDSVSMAYVTGVSCPSPLGLSAQQALDICFYAGTQQKVKLFDLSEYNPTIEEYNTGKMVAAMFVHFCMGYSLRNKQ
ncbi:hypothetical protein C9374_002088 [Naegleria lovaniensis]|uniref:Arginase n=1 Tax=Naegleria lovaniensis TaxID=51637 RepID=A0AA88KLX4_NAELO|nr:uncharacterized protein C9374_002088 [Naegleria lovaniensis]KAG2387053.1 hypothetical protein C9374_002088 [Naegleria lovaniensis]